MAVCPEVWLVNFGPFTFDGPPWFAPGVPPALAWLVNFGPFAFDGGHVSLSVGGEIDKLRPAVVVNAPAVVQNALRIVIPITDRKPYHPPDTHIFLAPTPTNGLTKPSSAVTPQIKSVATERFARRLGVLSEDEHERILAGVLVSIGLASP